MKAIIPAAGIGTRLRPHTYSVPKILMNVAGKPMISYIIDDLIKTGKVDNILIIVGHLGDIVQQYLTEKYNNSEVILSFIVQESMKGLGHAIYQAKSFISNEPVIIVLGDTIFEFNLNEFLNSDSSSLGVKDVDDPSRFGIVELSKDGYIKKLIEKPAPGITESKKAVAGIYYILNSDKLIESIEYVIDNNIKTKNEYQLTDALQRMVDTGEKLKPYEIENWFDCGKPETLLSTNQHLLEKNSVAVQANKYLNTVIVQPSFIGENCQIENSVIGPNATISDNCSIKNSIIEGSIIGDNSTIDKVFLSNSIIGSAVNVRGDNKQLYVGDSTDIKL